MGNSEIALQEEETKQREAIAGADGYEEGRNVCVKCGITNFKEAIEPLGDTMYIAIQRDVIKSWANDLTNIKLLFEKKKIKFETLNVMINEMEIAGKIGLEHEAPRLPEKV